MKTEDIEREMFEILNRSDAPRRARDLRSLFVALPSDEAHELVRRFFVRQRR